MKLSSISTPNFKGVYAIQVPKRYFPDQSNTRQVDAYFRNDFMNELDSRFGVKKQSFFEKVVDFFKGEKAPEVVECFEVLESPGYMEMKKVLEDGEWNASISWAEMNAGATLTHPVDENYNTFFILTGKEALNAKKAFSPANKFVEKQFASQFVKYSGDPFIDEVRETAKMSESLDKIFKEITKGKLVGVYKIEEFAKDFKEAINDIDFKA